MEVFFVSSSSSEFLGWTNEWFYVHKRSRRMRENGLFFFLTSTSSSITEKNIYLFIDHLNAKP